MVRFWKRKKRIYCWTRSRPTWTFGESDDQVRDKSESKYQQVQDKSETIEKHRDRTQVLQPYLKPSHALGDLHIDPTLGLPKSRTIWTNSRGLIWRHPSRWVNSYSGNGAAVRSLDSQGFERTTCMMNEREKCGLARVRSVDTYPFLLKRKRDTTCCTIAQVSASETAINRRGIFRY